MTEPSLARPLAGLVAPIHNVAYYSPEIRIFETLGVKSWWAAYFAYRSAPMGVVTAEVVAAVFYGFSPRMVGRAIPAVWEHLTPEQALAVRLDAVDRAWRRIFVDADLSTTDAISEAAALLRQIIEDVDSGGRPLYAGHTTLPWPDPPHLQLWHATTLLREHRGDGHTIALAAANVDPVQCQVLMAARGHGNRATLQKIRGWSDAEWETGVDRLQRRGWLDREGALTPAGRLGREAIEDHTDALAGEPARRLGAAGVGRATHLLMPVHDRLFGAGAIPRRWPPPHVLE